MLRSVIRAFLMAIRLSGDFPRRVVISSVLATSALGSVAWGQGLVPVDGEFQINTYTEGAQYDVEIASFAEGGFVAVWSSEGSPGSDDFETSIQGQLYTADGSALGHQFQVNTGTAFYQLSPVVTTLASGDFIVLWTTRRSSLSEIRGQRFAADGSPLGSEFQIGDDPSSRPSGPAIATLTDGNYVVIWSEIDSLGTDSFERSLHGRRFTAEGQTLGQQFQVNAYTTGHQVGASVTALPGGGFVTVWQSQGSAGSDASDWSIQGRRFAADGSDLGGDFQVNSYTPSYQRRPSIAASSDGGFVVVWASDGSAGTDTSGLSVQGRRFSPDGEPLGEDQQINQFTLLTQGSPAVAAQADGGFLVAWHGRWEGVSSPYGIGIQGRRFGADGRPLGGEFPINTYASDNEFQPVVETGAEGDFVVAWHGYASGSDSDAASIQAQRFTTPRFSLVGLAGKCLDVVDAGRVGSGGVPTQLFRCHGEENQRWHMELTAVPQKIRGVDGKCLMAGAADDSGNPRVVVGECDGADRWQLTTTEPSGPSALIHSQTGLCLDVEGAEAVDGTPVNLFDCHGRANQVWRVAPEICTRDSEGLCLNQDRFRVDVEWHSFEGQRGAGRAVYSGSDADDSGLLWFFEAENWEMLVKVLDGCALNERFWVFAAATTTVEYTLRVTDTALGTVREYFNPLNNRAAAITDTSAFATCPVAAEPASGYPRGAEKISGAPIRLQTEKKRPAVEDSGLCVASSTRMCLNDGRFSAEVEWRDFAGNAGSGRVADAATSDSGLFYFFGPDNWEMLVKVLDGCEVNDRYWLLAAATTNVEVKLRVTDLETGEVRWVFNPLGSSARVGVETFDTCP